MKKNILLIVVALFSSSGGVFAQCLTAMGGVAQSNQKIEFSGNYSLNSTVLNSTFLKSIYTGQFIDTDLKNSVQKKLGTYNLFGADVNTSALYFHTIAPRTFLYVGIGYNIDLGVQFTDDLFNLVFYGNKEYAGKTADLQGTQVKYMESQSLQFGFSKEWKDSLKVKHRMDLGMSLIKGQNMYDLTVNSGSVFTEQIGEYVDITIKGDMYQSDTNRFGLDAFNGLGVGLNFKYEIKKDTAYRILFEVKNVGYMRWNGNTIQNEMDTTLRFEGIEIDNIFAIQDSTFENVNAQTIAGDGLKTEKAARWMLLPLTIHANYRHYLNAKNYIEGDINYKNWGTYVPKLIVAYGRRFNRCLSAEINGGYGGYGNYHAGANFSVDCKQLQFKVGASDVLGFIAPKQFSNQGVYLMASYLF